MTQFPFPRSYAYFDRYFDTNYWLILCFLLYDHRSGDATGVYQRTITVRRGPNGTTPPCWSPRPDYLWRCNYVFITTYLRTLLFRGASWLLQYCRFVRLPQRWGFVVAGVAIIPDVIFVVPYVVYSNVAVDDFNNTLPCMYYRSFNRNHNLHSIPRHGPWGLELPVGKGRIYIPLYWRCCRYLVLAYELTVTILVLYCKHIIFHDFELPLWRYCSRMADCDRNTTNLFRILSAFCCFPERAYIIRWGEVEKRVTQRWQFNCRKNSKRASMFIWHNRVLSVIDKYNGLVRNA